MKQTGSSGDTLTETKNINKSLLTLGKVISTLSKIYKTKQRDDKSIQDLRKHIPFRDSMLTKLLMHSFLGNAFVLMICCCSPTSKSIDDTMATLRYASRAANIGMLLILLTQVATQFEC